MDNSTAIHHYFNQTVCHSAVPITLTAFLLIVSLLALTGNVLVIVVFKKTPTLKSRANYYIVNMAVSDLVSVFLTWPLYATEGMLNSGGSLITDKDVATFFCKLGIYSRAVSYVVSVVSLVLIAVDRFIAIAFPLKAVIITARIRTIFLPLSWVVPLLALIPYIIKSEIVQIEQQTFCRNIMNSMVLKIYHFLSFSLIYCVPLILILVLYPLIMRNLTRQVQLNSIHNRQRCFQVKTKRLQQNQNIMKIFGSIVLAFFTCWTPLYVYLFLKSLYQSIFIKDKCFIMVGLFYYFFPLLSTAMNPFILITFGSHFRAAAKSLCFHLFRKCSSCLPRPRVSPQENIALPALK